MILTADGNNRTDGVAYAFLQRINTDIPLVLVSRIDNYSFNERLNELRGKKWILFDFIELGWEWDMEEGHLWGVNTSKFNFLQGDEWAKFDEFVTKNPPVLKFCRELLKKDQTETLVPIEYPNWQDEWPIQSKDEFEKRPIEVMNFWGRSHELRVQTHGDIWKHASKRGFNVCDNIYFFSRFMENESSKKWVSLWMPHYCRIEIKELLKINNLSKLSLSLPGAGYKCFRSTGEAPVNSTVVMMEDKLAWAYQWHHLENCIKIKSNVVEEIDKALENPFLYEVYCNSVATANKYRVEPYINNYILPKIKQVCG